MDKLFLLWDFIKDSVYYPPAPKNLIDLSQSVAVAV